MAKISDTKLSNEIREKFISKLFDHFNGEGEDAHIIASNQITFPVTDAMQNEKWIIVTVTVPKGSRDGEPYDGYSMAEDYKMKQEEKQAKAEEAARIKAEKIEKSQKAREAKQKAKGKA